MYGEGRTEGDVTRRPGAGPEPSTAEPAGPASTAEWVGLTSAAEPAGQTSTAEQVGPASTAEPAGPASTREQAGPASTAEPATVAQPAASTAEQAGSEGSAAEPVEHPVTGVGAVPARVVFRWAVAAALGVAVVVGAAMAVYTVRAVLVQIFIALFAAVSLDPAVRWLIARGVRRSIAVAVIFALALLGLAGFLWSVLPPMINQIGALIDGLPDYVRQITTSLRSHDKYGFTQRLTEYLGTLPGKVGPGAFGFIQRLLGAVFNVLLVVVLTLYFMADLPRIRRGVVRLSPRDHRPRVAQAVNVVVDKVGGYMIGNLIISLFAGVSTFICLYAVGVPYALPLAFFVALTDLIPLVGATIGAAGCVVVALLSVDLWPGAVVVLLFFVAYQQLENYLIAPRVLRNTVDLSSVTVLVAALIGGAVLGAVGALMAIPVAAAGKVLMTPVVRALDEPSSGRPPPSATPPFVPRLRRRHRPRRSPTGGPPASDAQGPSASDAQGPSASDGSPSS